MLITSQGLSGLFTGFKVIFQQAFLGTPVNWDKVAMEIASSTSQEVYPWMGTSTGFREWLGPRVIQNLKSYDWTIKNKSYENTIGLEREKIEDDQYGVFNPVVAMLAQNARKHPDQLIFNLLKSGFTGLCYDGQYFFDTDHPVEINGAFTAVSNHGGGSGTPWYLLDTTKAIKPFIFQRRKDYTFVSLINESDPNVFLSKQFLYGVDCRVNAAYGLWQFAYASKQDLTADNYAAARAAMFSLKKENGESLSVTPNLLVVPPSLEGAARKLLKNEFNAAGATNEWFQTAEPLVVPELA